MIAMDLFLLSDDCNGSVSGLFFILPCMDSYTKVDLRTVSFDVPPQEVSSLTHCWGLTSTETSYGLLAKWGRRGREVGMEGGGDRVPNPSAPTTVNRFGLVVRR